MGCAASSKRVYAVTEDVDGAHSKLPAVAAGAPGNLMAEQKAPALDFEPRELPDAETCEG